MDIQIKLEPNSGSTCVICLKTDVQTFGKHEISFEISSIYKDLLKDHLTLLNKIGTTDMCFECMEALSGIIEFKKKCVNSIEILSTKMKTMDNVEEDLGVAIRRTPPRSRNSDLVEEDFFPPLIKMKDEIFVDDLPVQVEMKHDEPPKRSKRAVKEKPTKRQKVPEVTKQDPVESKKGEKTVVKRKPKRNEQKRGYCYICCMENPTIQRHVLDVHSRTFEDGVLRCLWCNEACADTQGVMDHLKTSHREFDHPKKCGKCEMETKSRETLFKHIHETHYKDRDKVYPCDFCDSVYYDVSVYKYHVHVHLGAVRCRYCEKSFYDQKALAVHRERHERKIAASNYICHFCGFVSKVKADVLYHLQMRHVETPSMKCDFCEKLFKSRQQLRSHVRRVHEEKRYQCIMCGRRFHNGSTLRKHVEIKHTENVVKQKKTKPKTRKYACDQCDMKFFENSTLKKHKFTHSKTRPFQCHMCPIGYYCNDYLQKHYLRDHGTNYTPKEIRKMCGFKKYDDSD